nr:hypothetical protein [uncultured Draconibacterium sp.]
MEHKRPNSEIKDVNKAELAVNEKWETPEVSVISVDETKLHQNYGSDAVAMS